MAQESKTVPAHYFLPLTRKKSSPLQKLKSGEKGTGLALERKESEATVSSLRSERDGHLELEHKIRRLQSKIQQLIVETSILRSECLEYETELEAERANHLYVRGGQIDGGGEGAAPLVNAENGEGKEQSAHLRTEVPKSDSRQDEAQDYFISDETGAESERAGLGAGDSAHSVQYIRPVLPRHYPRAKEEELLLVRSKGAQ